MKGVGDPNAEQLLRIGRQRLNPDAKKKEQSNVTAKKRSVTLNIYSDPKKYLSPQSGHQIRNYSFSQRVKLKLLKNSLALRFDAGFRLIVMIKFL